VKSPCARRTGSQKGISGPLFAAHYRLEQEAEGRLDELRVGGHRSVDVE